MRILWHSAKPTIPSGYGTQTALMAPALRDAGHEVAISCHAGLFGSVEMWNGIKMFPHSNYAAKYGMDLVEHHARHFKPDIVISFLDSFVLDPSVVKKLPWCAWTPVDSMPVMKRNIEPLKACRWVVSPTEWGREAIKAGGIKTSAVIPCAYDPKLFHVLPNPIPVLRKKLSEVIGVEIGDKFLINAVSANTGERKNFPAIFGAWRRFHIDHPNSMLFLHTDPTGYFFQGENLSDIMKAMEVSNEGVYFPPQWEYVCGAIGPDFLNLLYNCSDVHVNACLGEGFGLPIVEAQAAGCPVIVPNFGAAAELVTERRVSSVVNGRLVYSVPGAMQYQIDPEHLIMQLRRLESSGREARKLETRKIITSSVSKYRVENVLPLWAKFLATH